MKTTAELVFIPFPAPGHLFSMIQLAKQLVNHDQRLSATICLIPLPSGNNTNLTAAGNDDSRVRFVNLPAVKPPPDTDPARFLPTILEGSKRHIKELVGSDVARLAGFVVDMLCCTAMMDLGSELGVPPYVFYPSGANFLGFMLELQALHDEGKLGDLAELKDTESEMAIPSLEKPLPCKFLPSVVVEKEWLPLLIDNTRRLREARGIVVNTFLELETYALGSVSVAGIGNPPVYPVGPLLNLNSARPEEEEKEEYKEVMEWLDGQPAGSVVFLCFGSMGSFAKEQATEIATALERGGHRFLWSLRRPSEMGITGVPGEYENFDDVLPGGFLDRTSGVGKVIGWAPQMAVLGHQSVGGFVSHCGWNSMLESVWFGVPIGAWPMYAEQQLNAFQFVEDLGFAEEIRMDYRWGSGKIVTAEEIEGGIQRLMTTTENDSRTRKTMNEISEMSKKTLVNGGSSYSSMTCFIQDVIDNIPST